MDCITSFQKNLYDVVKRVPKGYVTTYKEIGKSLGSSNYRYIGTLLGENQSSDVPCHRVVLSSRELGGYNLGSLEKAQRLESEGVIMHKHSTHPSKWKVDSSCVFIL